MSEFIIPPMTDVGPVTKIEQSENGYKATIGYTAQAIDEMVLRINEKLDEELMARLAEQHGYKRVVLCRDCEHYRAHKWFEVVVGTPLGTDISDVCLFWAGGCKVEPDGFCAWGERKEDIE